MSNGKVEVSIEKWEEIRTINSDLQRTVDQYKEKESEIKIVLVDKEINYNVKYDRWKERNELVDKTKTVESVHYMKLDHVKDILDKEAHDKVKREFVQKDNKIKSLEKLIIEKDINHANGITVIKGINDKYIKELEAEKEKLIKQIAEFIAEFTIKSKEKELTRKIGTLIKNVEDLEIEVNKKDLKIDHLEKTNTALFKRIPLYKRIFKPKNL